VTVLSGFALLCLALIQVAGFDSHAQFQILIGTLLAAMTGLFPVRVPGAKTSSSAAEIFIFLLLLDYGPAAATIAAAAEAGTISWRTSARWTSRLGSPAMAALAMYACGNAFAIARSHLVLGGQNIGLLFGLLLLLAVAYSRQARCSWHRSSS
jgi:hypothetical protein